MEYAAAVGVEHESTNAITSALTRLSGEGGGGSDMRRCWAGAPPGGTRFVVDIDAELLWEGEAMAAGFGEHAAQLAVADVGEELNRRGRREATAVGVSPHRLLPSDHDLDD